jgi:GT2 family glycosyltransferase
LDDQISITVVVVSNGRPALLRRCLLGINQLFFQNFEVVVVADSAAIAAIGDLPFSPQLKMKVFDEENISRARNLAVGLAGGDVVAFIDDDAVPEPTWLTQISSPFSDPDVCAVAGYVLGRNGISLQWGAETIGSDTSSKRLPIDGLESVLPKLPKHCALKLQGTNFAVCRSILVELGGFDEAFEFYLDDTDFAFRLGLVGKKAAVAPGAIVHHGFAESGRRFQNRVPKSLFQIGASQAVYLRKHLPDRMQRRHLSRFMSNQRRRLGRLLVDGHLEPADVRRLMADLKAGFDAGKLRRAGQAASFPDEIPQFAPLRGSAPEASIFLSGRWFQQDDLQQSGSKIAANGQPVTLLILSPTMRAQTARFTADGIWIQSGGLFGRTDRADPRFQFWMFGRRVRAEQHRIEKFRGPFATNFPAF